MKAILRKVKWNKGQTEKGQAYDYTRVYLEVPVYDGSPNEFGADVMECEYGPADKHVDLLGLKGKLPVEVDVTISQAKKGNNLINVVSDLRITNATSKPA